MEGIPMNECSSCHAPLRDGLKFCPSCGAAVSTTPTSASVGGPESKTCPACATTNGAADTYCSACGGRLTPPPTPPAPSAPSPTATPIPSAAAAAPPPPSKQDGLTAFGQRHQKAIILGAIGIFVLMLLINWIVPDDDASTSSAVSDAPTAAPGSLSVSSESRNGYVVLQVAPATSEDATSITDYKVETSKHGADAWQPADDGVSASRRIRVDSLKNGREYDFRVAAVNALGQGPWSRTLSETPNSVCTADRLESLVDTYIDLGNRTISAARAVPEVLSPERGAKRIRIRSARTVKAGEKIIATCGIVSDAESGEAVVAATMRLNATSQRWYTGLARYLETGELSEERLNRLVEANSAAIKAFNATWRAFGDEVGFSIDDTPDTPVDESKVAD